MKARKIRVQFDDIFVDNLCTPIIKDGF